MNQHSVTVADGQDLERDALFVTVRDGELADKQALTKADMSWLHSKTCCSLWQLDVDEGVCEFRDQTMHPFGGWPRAG